jgi:hypothetical protein
MATAADDSDFERWVERMSDNPNAPADDPGEVSPAWRRWLRRLYDAEGPVPKEVVFGAAMEHQVALANAAVRVVLGDVHHTTTWRPLVEVDVWMGNSIRISIDGGFQAPSMWEVEEAAAVAEVADYFQDQFGECWPVCRDHNAGLHAEVRDGQAVWWCRPGKHAIAVIGELKSTA